MAKIFQFMTMLATLEALMFVAGLNFSTTLLLALGLNASGWNQGSLILLIIGTIGLFSGGAAITASFFGRSPSESYIITPIAVALMGIFIADIGGLTLYINNVTGMNWLGGIIFVISAGLAAGFAIAIVQFWRGNDI